MSSEFSSKETTSREPAPIQVTFSGDEEDEIDLLGIISTLWRKKWLIAGITFLFGLAGILYAFLVPPVYRAEAVLALVPTDQGENLSGSLGGLASLAGINLGSSSDGADAVVSLRSRILVEEFIDENDLLPVLFYDRWDSASARWLDDDVEHRPDIRDGVEFFVENVRSVSEDASTSTVTLTIEWIDPMLAAEWVSDLVMRVNERLRQRDLIDSERRLEYLNEQLERASLVELRQAISRLIENEIQTIMLAQAEGEYAFRVMDPPRVPKKPVSPKRLLISISAVLGGCFVGVVMALLQSAIVSRLDATNR